MTELSGVFGALDRRIEFIDEVGKLFSAQLGDFINSEHGQAFHEDNAYFDDKLNILTVWQDRLISRNWETTNQRSTLDYWIKAEGTVLISFAVWDKNENAESHSGWDERESTTRMNLDMMNEPVDEAARILSAIISKAGQHPFSAALHRYAEAKLAREPLHEAFPAPEPGS